jgi:hypothetical protein
MMEQWNPAPLSARRAYKPEGSVKKGSSLLLTHVLKMRIENPVEAIENTIPKCSEAGERQNKSIVAGKVRCNDV